MAVLHYQHLLKTNPFIQFLLVLIAGLILLLTASYWSSNPEIHWMVSTTVVAFYILINIVLLFIQKERVGSYVLFSFIFYALLNGALHYTAYSLSDLQGTDLIVYLTLVAVSAIFYSFAFGMTFVTRGFQTAFGMNEE